tara:strand:- start:10581 stop:10931 length:351 start_codon:yes stop_codon:yes gene_type:complete
VVKKYIEIKKDNLVVASQVEIADNPISRMIGLMFSKNLGERDGLLISPCNSIHTFFMRYELDIVFLSRDNKIVKIIRKMKPWRMTWMYFRAAKVLEMMGGTLPAEVEAGDELNINV